MMATYNNAHPLPSAPVGGASMQPPPQHQPFSQPPTTTTTTTTTTAYPQKAHAQNHTRTASMARDRRSRGMSFRSDKSHNSISGSFKLEPETHAEKEAKRLHSKADPSMAMMEAEPCKSMMTTSDDERRSREESRGVVYKDTEGLAQYIRWSMISMATL